jgi:hypothetical protein
MGEEFNKETLLTTMARNLIDAAHRGQLGKPLVLTGASVTVGPRAGACDLHVARDRPADAATLLSKLSMNDGAVVRQFIDWPFAGDPLVYMEGKSIRVEVGWPQELARTDIRLRNISCHPRHDAWTVGIDENGRSRLACLNEDTTPQWLVAGETGSGKSEAVLSAVCQLAGTGCQLVLIDGKQGGLCKRFSSPLTLQGMIGPVAADPDDWRDALLWAVAEMQARYARPGQEDTPLIIVIDEVQELVSDALLSETIRRLVTQGRDARVHCILTTQHPVVEKLGGAVVARNLPGRMALRVTDWKASEVALGVPQPRADRLLGCGDCYVRTPNQVIRVQVAMAEDRDFDKKAGDLVFDVWPEAGAPDLGVEPVQRGRSSPWPCAEELSVALMAANGKGRQRGRPWFLKQLRTLTGETVGSGRADEILALGRTTSEVLGQEGWNILPA